MKSKLYLLALVLLACSTTKTITLDEIAESYVRLVLEIGQYEEGFVDAYFGPEELRPTTEKLDSVPYQKFIDRSEKLLVNLDQIEEAQLSRDDKARKRFIEKQLIAVRTSLEKSTGIKYSFEEDARLLYDAELPVHGYKYYDSLVNVVHEYFPEEEDLLSRFLTVEEKYVVPADKLDTVMRVAIKEARRRTAQYLNLPKSENFELDYVSDKPWGAYNYYLGNSQSNIDVNTDNPISIFRILDYASHEGYPGHHVHLTILEQEVVNGKNWIEFSVFPTRSPIALVAEGIGNYGVSVAFPEEERISFEKKVLFPLAGLDTSSVDEDYKLLSMKRNLRSAGIEIVKDYVNGEITREEALELGERYLYSNRQTSSTLRFVENSGAYIINYTLGQQLVEQYVQNQMEGSKDQTKHWMKFKELLTTPHTASSLQLD
ncbi:hypothetical protein [Fulvivirga lutimaris]|uniref:hypothetical protein n=1 Tax=Fulvivirga lutimaris TaxID=1819566 RepID=UPI0012BBD29B|nr:hypothetical protein [Fulvivirga lutimaris]MTI41028.1 hypothetical protein [Fulvivirga lutimaris]